MLRDMPEEYRQKFRDFEMKAQHSAVISQYNSRAFITFEGVALQLRMSEKGNNQKQLIESYDPSLNNNRERGKNATLKMFQPESKEMRTILMSAIAADTTKETLEKDIKELLGSKQSMIESVEIFKKSALFVCGKRADVLECKHLLSIDQRGVTTKKVFCNEVSSQMQAADVQMQL